MTLLSGKLVAAQIFERLEPFYQSITRGRINIYSTDGILLLTKGLAKKVKIPYSKARCVQFFAHASVIEAVSFGISGRRLREVFGNACGALREFPESFRRNVIKPWVTSQ